LVVASALVALLSGLAHAATITVEGLERAPPLNIEKQGRISFEGIGTRVVCNMTVRGDLNTSRGTLALGGNEAGKLGEFRVAACEGGANILLNTLARPVRLSWTRVEARESQLAALSFEWLWRAIEIFGGPLECLYSALLLLSERAEADGRYRRLDLILDERSGRVLSVTSLNRNFCPAEGIRIRATLTITRPANGLKIILTEP